MAFFLKTIGPISIALSNSTRGRLQRSNFLVNSLRLKSDDKKDDREDDNSNDSKIQVPSISRNFVKLDDSVSGEIIDFHEEAFGFRWDEKHQLIEDDLYVYRKKNRPAERAKESNVQRGIHGVFDIEQIVEVLRAEKMDDIACLKIPERFNYTDYLVLATARSKKHLDSVIEYIRKLHKLKKFPSDKFLRPTIGKDSNWRIIDMDYIVVHLFLPNVREIYEIESLWCLGPDFDEKTLRPDYAPVLSKIEKHIKFLQEMQPMTSSSSLSSLPTKKVEISN